jgi:hypothetical protein
VELLKGPALPSSLPFFLPLDGGWNMLVKARKGEVYGKAGQKKSQQ